MEPAAKEGKQAAFEVGDVTTELSCCLGADVTVPETGMVCGGEEAELQISGGLCQRPPSLERLATVHDGLLTTS